MAIPERKKKYLPVKQFHLFEVDHHPVKRHVINTKKVGVNKKIIVACRYDSRPHRGDTIHIYNGLDTFLKNISTNSTKRPVREVMDFELDLGFECIDDFNNWPFIIKQNNWVGYG